MVKDKFEQFLRRYIVGNSTQDQTQLTSTTTTTDGSHLHNAINNSNHAHGIMGSGGAGGSGGVVHISAGTNVPLGHGGNGQILSSGINGNPNWINPSIGGGYTQQPVITWPHSSYFGLSAEEVNELNALEEHHKEKVKLARVEAFKALPQEFRQHVINAIIWTKEANTIKNMDDSLASDRLKELRTRNTQAIFAGHSHGLTFTGVPPYCGLTDDELIQAHLEAVAEEALTGLT